MSGDLAATAWHQQHCGVALRHFWQRQYGLILEGSTGEQLVKC